MGLPFGGDEPAGQRFVVLHKGVCGMGGMLFPPFPRGGSWVSDCSTVDAGLRFLDVHLPFPPFPVRFRSEARSALRWPMQCAAMDDAVRCVGRCSVLRFPGRCRGWFQALGLEGWQGSFCGCVERAPVRRAGRGCARAFPLGMACLSPWDGLPMAFWLSG